MPTFGWSVAAPDLRCNSDTTFLTQVLIALPAAGVIACGQEHDPQREHGCTAFDSVEVLVHSSAEDAFPSLIAGMTVDRRHRVYVIDHYLGIVVGFDSIGTERWRSGGLGAGPEEVRDPLGLTLLGDTVATFDRGNSRVSFWSTDGEPHGVHRLHIPFMPTVAGVAGSRHFWAMLIEPTRGPTLEPAPAVLVMAEFDERVRDTLARFESPGFVTVGPPGRQQTVARPFAPFAAINGGHDVVVFSRRVSYEIIGWRLRDGGTFTITGPSRRPTPTADHIRYARERLEGMDDHQALATLVPDSLPVVASVNLGVRGDVVVGTYWWRGGRQQWDRWSAQQQPVESVLLPVGMGWVTVVDDTWYGALRDSLGLQEVVRFRRPRSAPCIGPLAS